MTTFTVYTIDGEHISFDDNAEGFLVRWQAALVNPERQWPFAYVEKGEETVNGVTYKRTPAVIHYNPLTITAVEVEMSEDG